MELVEADLLDASSLLSAISGSSFVIHVASPFVIEEPRDPMVLIRPAVDGTLAVLEACKQAGVRRVCVTSSCAAIVEVLPEDEPDVFDESHWSNPDKPTISAYEKSKTLAERAAWDFVENLPEGQKIELTVINPAFVVGPTLIKGDFSSGKVINMFMNNNLPGGVPQISFGTVDVREVAMAHLQCIKRDEAQGKRFILSGRPAWFREIGEILQGHFGPMGYNIPTAEAKYCLVKFVGFFRSDAAKIAAYWGREMKVNN